MDQVAERHEKDFEHEVQEMVLIDKKGNKEKRLLKRYQRKGEDENFKYLMVFHDPSGVRGVALLTWQNKEKDDDQFMYLPSMGKKMKRIAKGGKRNYFMGTDFTFEDLVTESRDKFTYKRLPDETIDGKEYFVIEAYPEEAELKKSTGYKFRRLWVKKDIFFIIRTDYFDRRGRYIKQQLSKNLEQVDGNLWRAKGQIIDNKKMKHKFEIDERDIKDVKKNLRKDVVWLIWSSILIEANERDEIVKAQIQGLYQLFKYEFSGPKRNLKIPLIYRKQSFLCGQMLWIMNHNE